MEDEAKYGEMEAEMRQWLEVQGSTQESVRYLKKHVTNLDRDPDFVSLSIRTHFLNEVCKALKARNMSKGQLASLMGRDRKRIKAILEHENRRCLTTRTMARIAVALGMTIGLKLLDDKTDIAVVERKSLARPDKNEG